LVYLLQNLPPLRTVRAAFTAYGSSLKLFPIHLFFLFLSFSLVPLPLNVPFLFSYLLISFNLHNLLLFQLLVYFHQIMVLFSSLYQSDYLLLIYLFLLNLIPLPPLYSVLFFHILNNLLFNLIPLLISYFELYAFHILPYYYLISLYLLLSLYLMSLPL